MTQRSPTGNPFNNISAVIGLVLFFALLYFVLSGLFALLAWVAPVLLIITAIIDYTVITNFAKWTLNLFSKNWTYALITIGVLVGLPYLGFTFLTNALLSTVAGLLFGKAILKRKVSQLKDKYEERAQGEFVEYEEVETEDVTFEDVTPELPETLDLDEIPKQKPLKETRSKEGNSGYDEFFE